MPGWLGCDTPILVGHYYDEGCFGKFQKNWGWPSLLVGGAAGFGFLLCFCAVFSGFCIGLSCFLF